MTSEVPTVHSSIAEVWYLKDIIFGIGENRRRCKIITQNFNGPCSFIAICNILILRGDLTIEPPERQTVSYEFLSHLVAEYLLTSAPDVDVDASLSVMPNTQKGMDLNPAFTSPTEFHPAGEGKELKLFEQANIRLVHGWLVDPHSPEAEAVAEAQNYDNATILIAEADHLTDGRLVMNEDTSYPQAGSSSGNPNGHARWTEGDRRKVGRAVSLRHFLDATWSQLTYHGLFTLATTLEPGSLVALFRSSHLSVLYKSTDQDDSGGSALYSLVTDSSFLNESSVVWERLDDIDLGSSTFVDSEFIKSSPIGGDFAGHTAEDALAAFGGIEDPNDQALAQQLQAEEDEFARRQQEMHMREKAIRHAEMQALKAEEARVKQEKQLKNRLKHLKKSDCIIM